MSKDQSANVITFLPYESAMHSLFPRTDVVCRSGRG
jgi:hypothetical protein